MIVTTDENALNSSGCSGLKTVITTILLSSNTLSSSILIGRKVEFLKAGKAIASSGNAIPAPA